MVIPPYGGVLVDQMVSFQEFEGAVDACKGRKIPLQHSDIIHLTNIATGIYSPLTGFMNKDDYVSVVANNRLENGIEWPIPITLPVIDDFLSILEAGANILLTDENDKALAVMKVADLFEVVPLNDCNSVFGTSDLSHPGVARFINQASWRVGGDVIAGPNIFPNLRHFRTAKMSRDLLVQKGNIKATAFSTRNVCHLGHDSLSTRALAGAGILSVHIITGPSEKFGFHPDFVFETYEYLIEARGLTDRVILNNLRLPSLRAGPKEAVLQALMLQNLGYTDFIVGRDHAGVGGYYQPYASQEIFEHLKHLDIQIIKSPMQWYCRACGGTTNSQDCEHEEKYISHFRGTELRQMLNGEIPPDFDRILPTDLIRFISAKFEERTVGQNIKFFYE